MKLSDFEVMSFDCYGTLIDWESGIYDALQPLLLRTGVARSRDSVLQDFARFEARQQAMTPATTYPQLLAEVHAKLAEEWGIARVEAEDHAFGASIGVWPAFPDTVEALRYLKQHVGLVILSNVDRASFLLSNQRLGVAFDAVYTAQDIGSYKPDRRNFAYLLARLDEQGVAKERLLHVAQSLFHDHVPANALDLASAWIDRRAGTAGGGATSPVTVDVHYDFRFTSLEALAEAHRAGQ